MRRELHEDRIAGVNARIRGCQGDRPRTEVEEILDRHGERRLGPEEVERELGDLPTDAEG